MISCFHLFFPLFFSPCSSEVCSELWWCHYEGTEAWICLNGIIQTRAAHRSSQQLTALNTMVHHGGPEDVCVYSSASSASPWSRRAAIAGAVITPAFLLSDRAMGKEAVSAGAPVKLGQGNMQYGGLVA